MSDLVVIVPSRGRPESAVELAEAFRDTCALNTRPVFAVDADDPAQPEYWEVVKLGLASVIVADSKSMVEALNKRATGFAGLEEDLVPFAIGFCGDDHRPRTVGWDKAYIHALRELGTGIVYGDDLLQRENLPTQCAMTSDIIRALGYMAPPTLTHLYVDDFWKSLGEAADCLRYLPDVVIEHRHPIARKAAWDEGYHRVNAPEMYAKDEAAFAEYTRMAFPSDVEKVRALVSP